MIVFILLLEKFKYWIYIHNTCNKMAILLHTNKGGVDYEKKESKGNAAYG